MARGSRQMFAQVVARDNLLAPPKLAGSWHVGFVNASTPRITSFWHVMNVDNRIAGNVRMFTFVSLDDSQTLSRRYSVGHVKVCKTLVWVTFVLCVRERPCLSDDCRAQLTTTYCSHMYEICCGCGSWCRILKN